MKTFFLDTNVILNDPVCFKKFGKNNVVIPLIVLEELDSFKNKNNSIAPSARHAVREIDNLREQSEGYLHKGVDLESGGTLYVTTDIPEVNFSPINKNDNILLQSVINHIKNDKFKNVVLITEDINLRVRSDSLGVKTEEYKNQRVADVSFYEPPKEYYLSDKIVNKLANGKVIKNCLQDNPNDKKVFINDSLVVKSLSTSSKSILCTKTLDGVKKINDNYCVSTIEPRNKEQIFAFNLLMNPDVSLVVLAGKAGCGKTLLSLAAGLDLVDKEIYDQVLISRPVVPMGGSDIGYLPGDIDEKMRPWMAPIYDNIECMHKNSKETGEELFNNYRNFNQMDICPLTHIRGRSLSNKLLLVDEGQNLNPHEISTIVTRAGNNTKVVVTGDPYQIDNPYLDTQSNGISYLIDRLRGQNLFGYVTLHKGERSDLAEMAARLL